jgi:hypothetical protein
VTAFLPLAQAEWGTVPDWVTALGTILAFLVALRLLAKELAAHHEAEEDRRRAQVRLVAGWVTPPRPDPQAPANFVFDLVIRNASEEPIYDLNAVMVPPNGPHANDPEAAPPTVGAARIQRGTLPPDEYVELRFRMVPTMPGILGMSFTDAAGRRWKRYPDGRLVEPNRQRRSRKDYMNAWIAGELDHLDY